MKYFLPLCVAVLCLSFAGCKPSEVNGVDIDIRPPDRGPVNTVVFEADALPAFVPMPVAPAEEAAEAPVAEE